MSQDTSRSFSFRLLSRTPGKPLAALLTVLTLVTTQSVAQSTYFVESNKTIRRLGAQDVYFYVDFVEPFGQRCSNDVAYIPTEKKGLYAQLLAAKMSGKKISRIDYSQTGGDGTTCTVNLVEIIE